MSDFKSKLPSLQELTHIAGKLFKDVKNSVSEIIDEYKQKRKDEEAQRPDNASSEGFSSGSTSQTSNDVHYGTTNSANTSPPTGTSASSSTQPINATVEAQIVEPIDELTPTDAGVGYETGDKKPTKRKQKKTPVKDNRGDNMKTKPSTGVNPPDVEIEHHVDEQKPLKDDVL